MTILNIAQFEGRLTSLAAPEQDIRLPLANAIAALPDKRPIVIMVHGYGHHPLMPSADPTHHIFAPDVAAHSAHKISWPMAMGFGEGACHQGLCLTYSWPGRIEIQTSFWQRLNRFSTIYNRCEVAACSLAQLIICLNEITPDRPVNLLAHSLGARTALLALTHLPRNTVSRLVLMGAAVYVSEAQAIMRSPLAAQTAHVLNVTARENRIYDILFEAIAPRQNVCDASLGQGWPDAPANWTEMQLDNPETGRILARHGVGLGGGSKLFSHCGFYDRPGMMTFYRRLLADPDPICLETLSLELQQVLAQPRYAAVRGTFTRLLHRISLR